MGSETKSGGSGCLKILAGGCVALVVLVLVAIAGIWVSRDAIRDSKWFRSIRQSVDTAKEEFARMQDLRTSLLADYPSRQIDVRGSFNSTNGVSEKALIVRFLDPEFPLPDSDEAKQAALRQLAGAIAARYPTLARYDVLRIEVSRGGDGGGFSASTTFEFATSELPRPPGAQ